MNARRRVRSGTVKRVQVRGQVTHLDWAESDSEPNAEYEIARHADGTLRCACMAFVFNRSKPKTCKHLDAYRGWQITADVAVMQAQNAAASAQQAKVRPTKVKVGTETFTFRGISFSDDLAVQP